MIFLRCIDFIIFITPVWLLMRIGRGIGTIFYLIDGKHRRIAVGNLKEAFPEYPLPQIRRIARGAFQHLILVGIETLILSKRAGQLWRERVMDQGLENLQKARGEGKSILFLTGHGGNWEILASLGRWAGFIESVVARDVKSSRVQGWIQAIRARYGVKIISKGQIRHIIQEIQEKRTVGALIDQNGGRRGTFVPFFGRPASTPAGIVRFALKKGIPILPAFLRRISDRLEFRAVIGEDVSAGLDGFTLQEKERIALERFAQQLEKFVREDPAQWLWLHRRWKTRPEGEAIRVQKKVVMLHDGKPGHFNQILGVFQRLESWEGHICHIQFRSWLHRSIIYMMTYFRISSFRVLCWSLTPASVSEIPVWAPSLILACGSVGASVSFFLKKYYGAKSAVLMRSGFSRVEKVFDLAILPIHDRPPKRPNVISLQGIPTTITEDSMQEAARELAQKLMLGDGTRIGILIGGSSRRINMKLHHMQRLCKIITETCQTNPCQVLLATSRRTSPEIENSFKSSFGDKENVKLLFPQDHTDNPIPGILGLSDIVLVTEDSFSMLMEAVHSGRPVITIRLPRRGLRSVKYKKTLKVLEREGRVYRSSVRKLKGILATQIKKGPSPRLADNPEVDQSVQAILRLLHSTS